MNLNDMYEERLMSCKCSGKKESPCGLLAMLLMQNVDEIKNGKINCGQFYQLNKNLIDNSIKKIINDLEYSRDDLIFIIDNLGAIKCDFEYDLLWFVFGEDIEMVDWATKYRNGEEPLKIYNEFFNDEDKFVKIIKH